MSAMSKGEIQRRLNAIEAIIKFLGTASTTTLNGEGAPDNNLATEAGTIYIDTSVGDLYVFDGNEFELVTEEGFIAYASDVQNATDAGVITSASDVTGFTFNSAVNGVPLSWIGRSRSTVAPTDVTQYVWSNAKGETGDDGADGTDGLDGDTVAQLTIYIRSATLPDTPTGGEYNFSTNIITPPTGWSASHPNGDDTLYSCVTLARIVGNEGTDDTLTWSNPGILVQHGDDGATGAAGNSVFATGVYLRKSTTPNTPVENTGSFNFGTNILTAPTGDPVGDVWSVNVPAGDDPLYISETTFSISGDTGTDSTTTWAAPVLIVKDGETGQTGISGTSSFLFPIFIRSTSALSAPIGGSYNFTTNEGTAPVGWSTSVPGGTDPLYTTTTLASISGATGTDSTLTWVTPTILAQNGTDGLKGFNTATVSIYQRKATEPTDAPNTIGTYTFSTADLVFPSAATSSNNWHTTIAGATGSEQLYVRTATVASRDDTDAIAINEWTGVVIAGSVGEDGINNAAAVYYLRTDSLTAPSIAPTSQSAYNFETGALTPATNNTWQTFATISSIGAYLWARTATASARITNDNDIATSEWSTPILVSSLGADGTYDIVVYKDSDDSPLAKPVGGTADLDNHTLGVIPATWALDPTPGTTAQRQKSLTIISPTAIRANRKEKATFTEDSGVTGGNVVLAKAEVTQLGLTSGSTVSGDSSGDGTSQETDITLSNISGDGTTVTITNDTDPAPGTKITNNEAVNNIAIDGDTVVMGMTNGYISVTTDAYATFELIRLAVSSERIRVVATDGTTWFACSHLGNTWVSTTPSVEASWTAGVSTVPLDKVVAISSSTVWVGYDGSSLYTLSNLTSTSTWTLNAETNITVSIKDMDTDGTHWAVLSDHKVFYATDPTSSSGWTQSIDFFSGTDGLATDGTTWAIVKDQTIRYSTNVTSSSWSSGRSFTSSELTSGAREFSAASSGWMVTESSGDLVWTTTDVTGTDWTELFDYNYSGGIDNAFVGANLSVIVGLSSTLVYISDLTDSDTVTYLTLTESVSRTYTVSVSGVLYRLVYDSSGPSYTLVSETLEGIQTDVFTGITVDFGSGAYPRFLLTDGERLLILMANGDTYYSKSPGISSSWSTSTVDSGSTLYARGWTVYEDHWAIASSSGTYINSTNGSGSWIKANDAESNAVATDGTTWAAFNSTSDHMWTAPFSDNTNWTEGSFELSFADGGDATMVTDGTDWIYTTYGGGSPDMYVTADPASGWSWFGHSTPWSSCNAVWIVGGTWFLLGQTGSVYATTTPRTENSWTNIQSGIAAEDFVFVHKVGVNYYLLGSYGARANILIDNGLTQYVSYLGSNHAKSPVVGEFTASSDSDSMAAQYRTKVNEYITRGAVLNLTVKAGTNSVAELDSSTVGIRDTISFALSGGFGGTASTASVLVEVKVTGEDPNAVATADTYTITTHVPGHSPSTVSGVLGDAITKAQALAVWKAHFDNGDLGGFTTSALTGENFIVTSNIAGAETPMTFVLVQGTDSNFVRTLTITTLGAAEVVSGANTNTTTVAGVDYFTVFGVGIGGSARSTAVYNTLNAVSDVTDDYDLVIDGDTWSIEGKIFGPRSDVTSIIDSGKVNQTASSPSVSRVQGINNPLVWTTPVKDGIDGSEGVAGDNSATVPIYLRKSGDTPTTKPTGNVTYTFATGALTTGNLNGWSATVPAGSDTLYARYASAIANTDADVIASTEWSGVVQLEGDTGTAGINTATLYYYQWSTSTNAPALPDESVTYTFATSSVGTSEVDNRGWSFGNIPEKGVNTRLYQTTATAAANTATDVIATSEWSIAREVSTDGDTGPTGANSTVRSQVYYSIAQSSVPTTPTATSYNYETGVFTSLATNWSTSAQTLDASQSNSYWQSGFTLTSAGVLTFETPEKVATFTNVLATGGIAAGQFLKVGTIVTSETAILSGSGAILESDGDAFIGDSTNNIIFDQSAGTFTVNGTIIAAGNIIIDDATLINSSGTLEVGKIDTSQLQTTAANVDRSGGDGGSPGGGSNGTSYSFSSQYNIIIGSIVTGGGDGGTSLPGQSANGGDGGDISITSTGGNIIVQSLISTSGGDGGTKVTGAAGADGGNGGDITLNATSGCVDTSGAFISGSGGSSGFNTSGGVAGTLTQNTSGGNTCVT